MIGAGMARKDPRVDEYIKKAAPFARPILRHLRQIVHAGCPQVEETIKWQFPAFMHNGILCGIAAFKKSLHVRLLESGADFRWESPADREAMGHFGRITALVDLPKNRALVAYVRKAAKLNREGVKAPPRSKPKKKPPLKIPNYFRAALKKKAKAGRTFENLSPSERRDYVEWLTEAKRDETRAHRLKMSMLWLSQGKPRNWSLHARVGLNI